MSYFYSASSLILNYNPISLGLYSASNIIEYLSSSSLPSYSEKQKNQYIKNYNLIRKPTLQSIKNYKLVMLDMDGVLRNGYKKIGNSDIVIKKLNEQQIPYIILTNDCDKDPKTIKNDLKLMDIQLGRNNHIISASLLLKNKLCNILKTHTDNTQLNIGVITTYELFNYLKSKVTKISKSRSNHNNVKFYNIKDNMIPHNLDYIVVGCLENDEDIDKNLSKSFQWIYNNPSAKIIIGCPDAIDVINMKKITNYSPINILKEIESRVQNMDSSFEWKSLKNQLINTQLFEEDKYKKYKINNKQIIIGKPHLESMTDILQHYKIKFDVNDSQKYDNHGKILMIGDNLNTDMKLGINLNCDVALTMSGVTSYDDLINICRYDSNKKEFIDNIKYIIPDISYITI